MPGIDQLAQFPFPQWEGLFAAKLTEAWLCLGDVVQARNAAQRAVRVAEGCRFMFGAAWARRALARVAFAEGKYAAGVRILSGPAKSSAASARDWSSRTPEAPEVLKPSGGLNGRIGAAPAEWRSGYDRLEPRRNR